MIEWKNGDIYVRRIDGGPAIYKVIVKKNRRSSVVLRIYDVPQIEYNFAINARGEGYVGAAYLYSESSNVLSEAEYIRSMTSEEYDALLMTIAGALGFNVAAPADPDGSGQLVAQEGSVISKPEEAYVCETVSDHALATIAVAKIEAERDVYKELVYKLLGNRRI